MFPEAFIKRIQAQFQDSGELVDALYTPFYTSIRKHPVKGNAVSLDFAESIPWCVDAYYLKERPVFTLDPLFHAGAYYVQESSSMFIWNILNELFIEKDVRILDLCAAPGGKSTLIASWLNGNGLLVSNEVIKSRAQILLENLTKWGYANTWITSTDAYVLGGLDEFFDCIVLDAPCSGEGLFRKDRSAIEEWSEANCDLCASRQRKIVAEILPALNEGGYLVYSTCTFNPAENDENIQWMLKEFPLEVVKINTTLYSEIQPTDAGGYAFLPHHTKGEGFYCCVLRKKARVVSNIGIRKQKVKFDSFNTKHLPIDKYIKNDPDFHWIMVQQKIAAIPTNQFRAFEDLTSITKILGGYLNIGEIKGKDLVPEHALAMSIYLKTPFPVIELDCQEALYYLARRDFKIENAESGWNTITYQNLPLGFVKILSNRFNNYYPQDWRIRMDV